MPLFIWAYILHLVVNNDGDLVPAKQAPRDVAAPLGSIYAMPFAEHVVLAKREEQVGRDVVGELQPSKKKKKTVSNVFNAVCRQTLAQNEAASTVFNAVCRQTLAQNEAASNVFNAVCRQMLARNEVVLNVFNAVCRKTLAVCIQTLAQNEEEIQKAAMGSSSSSISTVYWTAVH